MTAPSMRSDVFAIGVQDVRCRKEHMVHNRIRWLQHVAVVQLVNLRGQNRFESETLTLKLAEEESPSS